VVPLVDPPPVPAVPPLVDPPAVPPPPAVEPVPPVDPVLPVEPPPAFPAVVFRVESTFMKLRLVISALYVPVKNALVHVAAAYVGVGRHKPAPASSSPPTRKLF
jgi:hypothetical protein